MVEMVILQTMHTKELKIEDHHIQIMTNEAFIIEDHPGQVIGFKAPTHVSILIMSFILPTLLPATQKYHHMQETQFIKAIYCHPS